MKRSVELDPRSDHDVFSDGDEIVVGKITVAVDERVFADGDIFAVIAAERFLQPYAFSDGAQQAFQYFLTFIIGIRRDAVESVYQGSGFISSLQELLGTGIVVFTAEHSFFFCHGKHILSSYILRGCRKRCTAQYFC